MAATLKLTREGVGIELRRGTFEVLIDGNSVGSINWHDTSRCPSSRGVTRSAFGQAGTRARIIPSRQSDGEMVAFQVHGAMVWPRWVASMLKPDLAISLKRE